MFIFSPFVYAYVSINQTDKRTDYNGKEISEVAQKAWDKNFSEKKINFVYGNEWHAGNMSYHLKSRPKWLGDVKDKDLWAFKICDEKGDCTLVYFK